MKSQQLRHPKANDRRYDLLKRSIVRLLTFMIKPELVWQLLRIDRCDSKNTPYTRLRHYLWFSLLAAPYPATQQKQGFLNLYFPQINFNKLMFIDFLRIPIQLIWLTFVLPIDHNKPGLLMRFKQKYQQKGDNDNKANPMLSLIYWISKKIARQAKFSAQLFSNLSTSTLIENRPLRFLIIIIAVPLAILCITVPFSISTQLTFALLLWVIALWLRSIPGSMSTLFMVILSVIISTRYIWWRVTATLNWDDLIDFSLGIGLLLAEVYAWLILLLGYFQTALPLQRKPKKLPEETAKWPNIDIYIPTYNEPLSVIKPTLYAAMGLDWPKEKFKVYLLDDGKRDEFRTFAEKIGCDYLDRPDNSYAKAGNLNHALHKTNGEFITIFDCDHIPTRSFLQMTMGWFLTDSKLALVQTPHHFFSADPFERNLHGFRTRPNEGSLFYGLIQEGNDLWNATFFCGSCAVLRRAPLLEIGGIATETVTEDAHTALKMHRLGYRSAYINLVQAAGLATESLSAHIGQRIRWARGMAQIFRLDNPILGKGLSVAQRICYSNAMLHFFYGFPRLVFMTAPLAFLLLHAYVIHASAILIALYVVPHMIHAVLTNVRTQGEYRNSMWAEMYESVLAWYILRPTTMAIINPKKGTFNVTEKGGLIEKDYFNWIISRPYLILVIMCLTGFIAGIYRLFFGATDEVPTVIINLIWISYNLIILGGAVAVAYEIRQVRGAHRVDFDISAFIQLNSGKLLHCLVRNYSETGLRVDIEATDALKLHQNVTIVLRRSRQEFTFSADIIDLSQGVARLKFLNLSQQQEADLVQCTFARADAWEYWRGDRVKTSSVKGLKEVLIIGIDGYRHLFRHIAPFIRPIFLFCEKLSAKIARLLPQTPDLTHLSIKNCEGE